MTLLRAGWSPHDPQSDNLFGIINASYVPFTAGSPKNDAAYACSGQRIEEIDTVWFFWSGSGKDTIAYNVRLKTQTASRAMPEKPAGYSEPGRGGPPPAGRPR